jgi:hypothetical protein
MKNQIETIRLGALVAPGYLYLFGVLALAMNLGGAGLVRPCRRRRNEA